MIRSTERWHHAKGMGNRYVFPADKRYGVAIIRSRYRRLRKLGLPTYEARYVLWDAMFATEVFGPSFVGQNIVAVAS